MDDQPFSGAKCESDAGSFAALESG